MERVRLTSLRGSSGDVMFRQLLAAAVNRELGAEVASGSHGQTAAFFTALGFPCSVDDLKNAKRRRKCDQLKHLPETEEALGVLDVLRRVLPDLDATLTACGVVAEPVLETVPTKPADGILSLVTLAVASRRAD